MNEPPSTTGARAKGDEPVSLPGLPADWDRQATNKVLDVVDQVKVKTSGPAIGVARAAVFGLLALMLAMIAVPLFLVGIVRLLNNVLPKDVWLVYLILGALFMAVGGFLWSRRPRRAAS